ncbi:MAG TPA: YciI family protein [Blastocatellia bacterium]|nr:YciI family protein [Blastocatellia bacterium]
MAQYMLISHHPMEAPQDVEFSPEMIQAVIQKYNAWTEKLRGANRLAGLNKLQPEPGRHLRGHGASQVVTDGPYAETKELIGGYWLITADDYDQAVELSRDCPSLEFGGRIEVREVEEL